MTSVVNTDAKPSSAVALQPLHVTRQGKPPSSTKIVTGPTRWRGSPLAQSHLDLPPALAVMAVPHATDGGSPGARKPCPAYSADRRRRSDGNRHAAVRRPGGSFTAECGAVRS